MFEKEFDIKDVDMNELKKTAGAIFHELSEEDLEEIAGGQGVDARTSTPAVIGGVTAGIALSRVFC
ncbi:MAG: bacteriocin [Turicibacter sp.]|nr:bacteriocin [Turicibacter sp.]